jgi:tetratricopeptide (TPR) repeat protein
MGFNDTGSGPLVRGGAAEAVSFSAWLIGQGRYAEAFKLLAPLYSVAAAAESSIPPDLRPSLYFNAALCLIAAEEYTRAAAELEKALESLKRAAPIGGLRPPAPGSAAGSGFVAAPAVPPEYTAVWQKLRGAEPASGACVMPFRPDYPLSFPREAREDITLTLIGVCERCGLKEKVKSLRAALTGPEFEEYKRQRV